MEGIHLPGATAEELADSSAPWLALLPETRLQPHARFRFEDLDPIGPVTHVRLNIAPDGGIARLRVFGRLSDAPR
jgi:allantoicase